MTNLRTSLLSIAVLALAVSLAACSSAGASGSPSGEAGASGAGASGPAGQTGISGRAIAGPVCPVQKSPPDPSCADRPVTGAVLIVRDAAGIEVRRATSGADGTFEVTVTAGAYVVEPQAVTGLMGTPAAEPVTVNDGAITTVELVYDTGIRLPAMAS